MANKTTIPITLHTFVVGETFSHKSKFDAFFIMLSAQLNDLITCGRRSKESIVTDRITKNEMAKILANGDYQYSIRLMASHTHEILKVFHKITAYEEFPLIKKSLTKSGNKALSTLLRLSRNRNRSRFFKALGEIRNELSFHYGSQARITEILKQTPHHVEWKFTIGRREDLRAVYADEVMSRIHWGIVIKYGRNEVIGKMFQVLKSLATLITDILGQYYSPRVIPK